MEQYLSNLIKQFKLATGTKKVDENSKEFIDDFISWIRNRQMIGKDYIRFLEYMGFNIDDRSCAEVGKGEYDTVVKPFNTTIITSCGEIPGVSSDRIINGKIIVYDSTPILLTYSKGYNQLREIPNESVHTFMTQNHPSRSFISGWEDLHNSGRSNIILGVYGSIYDKDKEAKISDLELFGYDLTRVVADFSVDDGNYFYAIGSDINEYKRVRRR